MKRNIHLIGKKYGGKQPSIVACLVAQYELLKNTRDTGPDRFRVLDAALSVFRWTDGKETRARVYRGKADYICDTLAAICRAGSRVRLFAPEMYRTLTGLGLFQRIDNKQWTMTGDCLTPGVHSDVNAGKQFSGFCVLEDRTTILVVRSAAGGTLHATGTENYGVEFSPGKTRPLTDYLAGVKQWVQDYLRWLRDSELGSVQNTLASQAMYGYRKRFVDAPIVVHNYEKALALERQATYGGRCEAFYVGGISRMGLDGVRVGHYGREIPCRGGLGRIYHLDANSLYGAVARKQPMPSAIQDYQCGQSLSPLKLGLRTIADVTVSIDAPMVPYRPDKAYYNWLKYASLGMRDGEYISKTDSPILYPTGAFRTCLCGPELTLVWQNIVKVHQFATYQCHEIFTEFSEFCWNERLHFGRVGNENMGRMLKVFSQALYGKFIQRARGWKHAPNEPAPQPWHLWYEIDPDTRELIPWRSIAGRVERYRDDGEARDSCPAIGAWVASLARVWLWQAMQLAGPSHVYYVDTDSLMVDEIGYNNLLPIVDNTHSVLGALKICGIYDKVEIYGIKHYVADGKVTMAGVAFSDLPLPHVKSQTQQTEPLTAALQAKRPPEPYTFTLKRSRIGPYRHGHVLSDGTVVPFRVNDIEVTWQAKPATTTKGR